MDYRNIDAAYMQALRANASAPIARQQPKFVWRNGKMVPREEEKPKSKRGSGNQSPLSAWISELSGAGGAAGGAAAGAAIGSVVPGIGTLIGGIGGGIVGGFLGGTGGRLAENKIRDNEYRLGDALKEGAWSGAFGGVGPAFQGARGAYAAGKAAGYGGQGIMGTMRAGSGVIDDAVRGASKGTGLIDDALSGSGKLGRQVMRSGAKSGRAIGQGVTALDDVASASRTGMLGAGDKMRNYNRGITVGNRGLKPADAAKYGRALDDVNKWFGGIGKSKQFSNADDAMKALSNQYKVSGEGTKAFTNADDVLKAFKKELSSNPSLKGQVSKGVNKTLRDNLEKSVKGFKTNEDFLKYVTENINPRYRDLVSKTGSMGSKETQIYEAFRRATKQIIDENLPSKSGINKQFANLMGASDELGQTITRDTAAGASQGLSPGRLGQNVLGPSADVLGRGAQQAGRVTQYTTPIASGAIKRGVVNQMTAPMPEMQQEAPTQSPLLGGPTSGGMMGAGQMGIGQMGTGQQQMPQSNSPFAPQNMQSSIAQILQQGGDFDDVKDYLSIATTLQEIQGLGMGGASQELNVTKPTSEKYAQAAGGVQALNQLEQIIASDPSVISRTRTPGRGINVLGIGSNIREATGTGQFDTLAFNTVDNLLRILTGAQAPESEIRRYMSQYIPAAGDSPETVQTKLQSIRQQFNSILDLAQPGAAQGANDFQSALSQYAPY